MNPPRSGPQVWLRRQALRTVSRQDCSNGFAKPNAQLLLGSLRTCVGELRRTREAHKGLPVSRELFDQYPGEVIRELVALICAQERLPRPELLHLVLTPKRLVALVHLCDRRPVARVVLHWAQTTFGVDSQPLVEPSRNRQMRQQCMRGFMRNHRFQSMQLALNGDKVRTTSVDEHAP
jgi:hypothetical protein